MPRELSAGAPRREVRVEGETSHREVMWIAVVDDNLDIVEVIGFWLNSIGYDVRAFDTAERALAALHEGFRPSLIILDLNLPGMNGYEFRRKILDNASLADIPVVVLTAHTPTQEEKTALAAATVLEKPVALPALQSAIETHRLP